MVEVIYKYPDIYKIDVPLKGNALKNLNSYVIMAGDTSIVIDTGFRTEDCKAALMAGLEELGISPAHTNLFVTHFHSDHFGLAQYFAHPDSKIYMGKTEYEYYLASRLQGYPMLRDQHLRESGFPADELAEARMTNPATKFTPSELFEVNTLLDGETVKIGDIEIEAIEVPGHTPGQMCFYIRKNKIMFLADHVLFDITPNIIKWHNVDNSLKLYLNSLDKISRYEVELPLPAHRHLAMKTMEERIEEIKRHHDRRADEICAVIEQNPGLNAYEIASKLTWSLHGATWQTAPKQQKWFAVGETDAHLDYLVAEGRLVEKNLRFYLASAI